MRDRGRAIALVFACFREDGPGNDRGCEDSGKVIADDCHNSTIYRLDKTQWVLTYVPENVPSSVMI